MTNSTSSFYVMAIHALPSDTNLLQITFLGDI